MFSPGPPKVQINLQTADQEMITATVGVSGAVRGYVDCIDGLDDYYSGQQQTVMLLHTDKKTKHIEERVVSHCIVRMLSGWAVQQLVIYQDNWRMRIYRIRSMDHLLVGGLYKASFHSLSSSLLSHIPTL
jgi:hypothetical protein